MTETLITLGLLESVAVAFIMHRAQKDGVMNETLVDECIADVAVKFGCTDAIKNELKLLLTARYKVQMDIGVAVYLPHESWISQLRQSPDFSGYFWTRYRTFLASQLKLGEPILKSLDESTEKIVDLCGNPTASAPFQRRGLIIGDVQSGKTANYIGICCKAADAGYRVIVLLTGTLESLRKQTQRRLDEGFVGFNTNQQAISAGGRRELLGVGLIDQRAGCQVLTTSLADFSTQIASQANIKIEGSPFPTLLVTKKNYQNLENIIRWLRNCVQHGANLNAPILVIDDESDNASVNTNDREAEATRINSQIRRLLGAFNQASYVGVTATPFANVFIRHDSVNEMIGDDLFPKHFIYSLSPPTNYWGVHRLFGDQAEAESARGFTLTDNEDAEAWLPLKHKIGTVVTRCPESLDSAVRHFVVATAIRDIRDHHNGAARSPQAMLVNVSRFTQVQNAVRDALEKYRRSLLCDLEAYSATTDLAQTEAGRRLLDAYREISEIHSRLDSQHLLPSWDAIQSRLTEIVRGINTTAVNSDNSVANLDFTGGKRQIVVGGNSLSRGITLDGLNTSYFYRRPLATDTLVQMGRWFGYRDGYVDLCRVYLSDDAQVSFAEASETLGELRMDIEQMNNQGRTPMDFGLKVLHHPGRLAITAAKKMRESREVTAQVTISETFIETRRVSLASVGANRELVEQFCAQFANQWQDWNGKPSHRYVKEVPRAVVADLLDTYSFHYMTHGLYRPAAEPSALAEFIREKNPPRIAGHELVSFATWDVALVGGGEDQLLFGGTHVSPRLRTVTHADLNKTILIGGTKLRVGGPIDEAVGLSEAAMAALKSSSSESLPGKAFRARRSADVGRPLLIVHPVTPRLADGTSQDLPMLIACLSLSFPTFDDRDASALVKYRINTVAAEEYGFESDSDSDDIGGIADE